MAILNARQKQRYDTAANWTSANPLLLAGELGIESDTNKVKVGDGTKVWNNLTYLTTNVPSIDDIGDVTISGTVSPGSALVYIDNAWRKGPVIGYQDPNQDQYFDNVALLLKFNGVNNTQVFTDSSKYIHTMQITNNPIISTTQSKYEGSSGRFGYFGYTALNNALYNTANINTINPKTTDFTIEAWIYIDEDPSATTAKDYRIWGYPQGYPGSLNYLFNLYFNAERTTASNLWRFNFRYQHEVNYISGASTPYSFAARQWHHVALTRSGTTFRIYVNGTHQASETASRISREIFAGTFVLGSGSTASAYSSSNFSGYIDDFRITTNLARYTGTSPFTVPSTLPVTGITNPRLIYPLNYHDDVSDAVPLNKQTLAWNASASQFEPRDVIAKQINNTTPPSTATSTGTAGEVRYDSSYIYLCTATNTWIRAALNTW